MPSALAAGIEATDVTHVKGKSARVLLAEGILR